MAYDDDCPIGWRGMHHWVATDESGDESMCDWCSATVRKGGR
jgi:hypothetical protein